MMASDTRVLRVGVIGTGFGTSTQIPGLQAYPRTEVVAVVSAREARAREAAEKFHVPHYYTDYQKFLEQTDVDAVSITSPPPTHHPMTIAALRAGKHVLCEKPFAMDQMQAEEMLAEAQRTGLAAMIDHEFRFVPSRAFMHQLTAEGYIGQPYVVNVLQYPGGGTFANRGWSWWSDKSQGGGVFQAIGMHLVDAVRVLFGEFGSVCAQFDTWIKERKDDDGKTLPVTSEDTFGLMGRLQNGALVSIGSSLLAASGPGNRIEAYGSEGTLILEADGTLLGSHGGTPLAPLEVPEHYFRRELLPEGTPARLQPFITLVEQFCGWALDGTPARPSFEDGVQVQRVHDAIRKSNDEHCWTNV
jgi:predicted dehydrogenase